MFDPPDHSHLTDEQIHQYLFGDLPETDSAHLQSCDICQSEMESFRRTVDHLAQWSAPPRPADYGSLVWRRLAAQIAQPRKPLWRTPAVLGWSSAVACGIAVVLIVLIPHRQPAIIQPPPIARIPISERLLQVAVQDHVRRAASLLTKLESQPEKGAANRSDRASEWEAISNLVAENRLYRQTAEQEDDRQQVQLLTDLERPLSPSSTIRESHQRQTSRLRKKARNGNPGQPNSLKPIRRRPIPRSATG